MIVYNILFLIQYFWFCQSSDHHRFSNPEFPESHTVREKKHTISSYITSGACKHFYFDMGTNIGVQLRKLYEPHYFNGKQKGSVLPFFEKYFGENRRQVCAIGFEPNRKHTSDLSLLQNKYQAAGFPLVIFTEVALSWKQEDLTFYPDPKAKKLQHEWGASLINWKHYSPSTDGSYNVSTIEAGRFYRHIMSAWDRSPDSKVLAKMDIEGYEYLVLPNIINHGALCLFDLMFIEWHDHMLKMPQFDQLPFPNSKNMTAMMNYMVSNTPRCPFQISELDDETYFAIDVDEFPWPNATNNDSILKG